MNDHHFDYKIKIPLKRERERDAFIIKRTWEVERTWEVVLES
jgi:hypothetical protein